MADDGFAGRIVVLTQNLVFGNMDEVEQHPVGHVGLARRIAAVDGSADACPPAVGAIFSLGAMAVGDIAARSRRSRPHQPAVPVVELRMINIVRFNGTGRGHEQAP